MKGRAFGLIIFILAVAVVAVIEFGGIMPDGDGSAKTERSGGVLSGVFGGGARTVTGYIGSEKANFLASPDVQEILRERYGLEVDVRRAGSFEMIDLSQEGIDFLWPSSQVALEKYRAENGTTLADRIIFNSPIVLYSWTPVVESLQGRGLIRFENGVYVADLPPLLDAILDDRQWSELGVDEVFGRFSIISTDPLRSNSGNMYAGLVASILAGGIADASSLSAIMPAVREVFTVQGQMEHSTGTLFERYLQLGTAQYPLVVGYESQYIEFARENPDLWSDLSNRIVLLYPVPTVWSSHPVIALTDGGQSLIEALQDEELQQLAWTQHGFRSGALGAVNDPADLGIERVAPEVTQVIQMPRPDVMFSIMDGITDPDWSTGSTESTGETGGRNTGEKSGSSTTTRK